MNLGTFYSASEWDDRYLTRGRLVHEVDVPDAWEHHYIPNDEGRLHLTSLECPCLPLQTLRVLTAYADPPTLVTFKHSFALRQVEPAV